MTEADFFEKESATSASIQGRPVISSFLLESFNQNIAVSGVRDDNQVAFLQLDFVHGFSHVSTIAR